MTKVEHKPQTTDSASQTANDSTLGSTAIVTGAGGGIGQQLALSLADAGWRVVVADIDGESASNTASKIRAEGGQALGLACDVGSVDSVESFFKAVSREIETPSTLLVNNAGVQTWKPLLELSVEEWNRTIATNLTGCFLMTRRFASILIEEGGQGSIVNLGSGCNTRAFPGLVDYTASKGGIEMFTKSAALELGPSGIRVNCVAPGAIATERTANETGDYGKSWSHLTPLGRIGQPTDVADAVLLLADDRAGFITGQTLGVDGGLFSRAIWPESY